MRGYLIWGRGLWWIKWWRGPQGTSVVLVHLILNVGSGDMHICYFIFCARFFFFNEVVYSATRKKGKKKDFCDYIGTKYPGWEKMKEVSMLENDSELLVFVCSFVYSCRMPALLPAWAVFKWTELRQVACFQTACVLKKLRDGNKDRVSNSVSHLVIKPFYN